MVAGSTRSGISRLVGFSRYFIVIDVIGLFAAFMALTISSVWSTFVVIYSAAFYAVDQKELVGKLVQQADTALLATVLYVIALGLYSLFVDDDIPMPAWLQIHHLDDLKQLLAAVVVVVLGVLFLGYALTWNGSSELLTVGLACAAVIAGLSFFLWQSAHEHRNRAPEQVAAADSAAVRPAATVYLADSGTQATDTPDPTRCVTAQSKEKNDVWILEDVGGFGGSAMGQFVNSVDQPNWGGPSIRHGGRSQTGFLDGHAEGLKPVQWYWQWTPWLNPALGGGSTPRQKPRMPQGY